MDIILFFIFLLACGAAAVTGVVFKPGVWYENLEKPAFTPPNWVFPIAWTSIYVLISFAGARLAVVEGNAYAMAFWAAQAALSTLWTPLFFGLHKMKAGLLAIVPLWLCVLGCLITAFWLDFWAGLAFIPYMVWVSIAVALNFEVWRLNRKRGVIPSRP
ncbi:tryptophan-rich sensory protein [Sulfitobacter sp. F26169L]|uniref:tryptophan-rich sensory protein TspO n=1 Tax=Sulfitobacter sp. F26169L TaxID=2996015 RepID=UPI002260E02F|nr:TspO/MBR family protein [Sulfitobacter sp. F26169L]MCX7566866.1 tryptophan-rich sensory protein [Sulfitobacter sp. F26169L]